MNPQIEGPGPRRLQCSLRFANFFKHFAPGTDPKPPAHPSLFGVEYPAPVALSSRGGCH